MRVIAIGATGFIGRHVVTRLIEAGHEVAVLHRGRTLFPALDRIHEILAERSAIRELRSDYQRLPPRHFVTELRGPGVTSTRTRTRLT